MDADESHEDDEAVEKIAAAFGGGGKQVTRHPGRALGEHVTLTGVITGSFTAHKGRHKRNT